MTSQSRKSPLNFNRSRRRFFQDVGTGMLVAGLGSNLVAEMGVAANVQDLGTKPNPYGDLAAWVGRMQDLDPDKLQLKMVEALKGGDVSLKQLVSSAALANAETFGGQDYVGYHAEMALLPALEMADDLPDARKALPVLKVIYRNSSRIQQFGAHKKTLRPVSADEKFSASRKKVSVDRFGPELRTLVRQADMVQAEQLFATVHENDPTAAFDTLLYTIADEVDVHRFVLAYRGMGLINVAGAAHSHTLLRQCVRHCVDFESKRIAKGKKASPIREHIPKLMDEFGLAGKPIGDRVPDSKWLSEFSETIYHATKFESSRAVAAAIAEGISPNSICQAISIACNQLTLRQAGNPLRTHGASNGVHSSDAANAWRQMIGHANELNRKVGLLVSAWHVGRYDQWQSEAYPLEKHFELVTSEKPKELLGICEEAIRGNDQGTAAAAIARYGDLGHEVNPVFDLLLKYAISEDGRLHSEKFYRTVKEEFAFLPAPYNWHQVVALARVTASAFAFDVKDNHGHRAPGYEQACELLGVDA